MEKFNYADVDFPLSPPLAGRLKVSLKKPRGNRNPAPNKRDRGNGRGSGNPGPNKKRKVRTHSTAFFFPFYDGTNTPQKAALNKKMAALRSVPLRVYLKS